MLALVPLCLLGALLFAVLLLPLVPGLRLSPVTIMLQAFRSLSLVGILFLLMLLGAWALLTRRHRSLWAVGGMMLITAAALFPSLGAPSQQAASVPSPAQGVDELRVSWNTDQQPVDDELLRLVRETGPDLIVLPEWFTTYAAELPRQYADLSGFTAYGWDSSASTILISKSLGDYELRNEDTPAWAGMYLAPRLDTTGSPRLVVAHLQRPLLTEGSTLWQEHVSWVESRCNGPDVIAVGDFNATTATLGSTSLGTCRDVGSMLGTRESGTWPSFLPAALGAQIDRVMAADSWRASWSGTVDADGSDHRPVFAVLRRNGS